MEWGVGYVAPSWQISEVQSVWWSAGRKGPFNLLAEGTSNFFLYQLSVYVYACLSVFLFLLSALISAPFSADLTPGIQPWRVLPYVPWLLLHAGSIFSTAGNGTRPLDSSCGHHIIALPVSSGR